MTDTGFKRPMKGRPPKAEADRRTCKIVVYVTPSTYAGCQDAARSASRSLSTWAAEIVTKEAAGHVARRDRQIRVGQCTMCVTGVLPSEDPRALYCRDCGKVRAKR